MPSTKRRIGIIGVGFGAQVHVPGFRSEGWDVAAICSRNREKAQKAAADAVSPMSTPTLWRSSPIRWKMASSSEAAMVRRWRN